MNMGIILAGGKGTRFHADIPKQFVKISGKPIIAYTLEVFEKTVSVDEISVVCSPEWNTHLQEIGIEYGITKLKHIIESGDIRFGSIYHGIIYHKNRLNSHDYIIIQDSVRPFVTKEMIEENIAAAKKHGASLVVGECYDTMYMSENKTELVKMYPREKLYKGQSPETIRYDIALRCYQKAYQSGNFMDPPTNLLMNMGEKVVLTKGGEHNLKITSQEDIVAFQMIYNKISSISR